MPTPLPFAALCVSLSLLVAVPSFAQDQRGSQVRGEKVDLELIARIKEEGQQRSQVMNTISFLTDVHGPRLTGSPQIRAAGEWTKSKLNEWGLANPHLEPWGPFGRGWDLEGFTANMIKPSYSPLIAFPKAWSPSTPKTIRGVPVFLDAATEKDLDQYRGKLHRAIVLFSPPREVKALFDPPAQRRSDSSLLSLANGETRSPRSSTQPSSGTTAAAPANQPPPSGPTPSFNASPQQRAEMQLASRKWQMIYDEGAAVVLEPGRGDGGTVFVSSATLPRAASSEGNQPSPAGENRNPQDNNPFSRGPRPGPRMRRRSSRRSSSPSNTTTACTACSRRAHPSSSRSTLPVAI